MGKVKHLTVAHTSPGTDVYCVSEPVNLFSRAYQRAHPWTPRVRNRTLHTSGVLDNEINLYVAGRRDRRVAAGPDK